MDQIEDIFGDDNQIALGQLFPKERNNDDGFEGLKEIFRETEECWNTNKKRYNDKVIEYLLICEAPPHTGEYFYKNPSGILFNAVWKTFFNHKPCANDNYTYQCLANEGFLLVDTLPFSLMYGNTRYTPEYHDLIEKNLHWWLTKLNQLNLSEDLKVAFGYSANALNVIIALQNNKSVKAFKNYNFIEIVNQLKLNNHNIAASKAGQPIAKKLKKIFKIKTPKKCQSCP